RKALTPNDFRSLADVEARLLGFQRYYESIATPFEWRFTKADLAALMRKLDFDASALAAVA
ncbi:MAG: transposase, partial [Acidobacteria bacterium]|nr:transposase [Acidobacteriota bacterium]